MATKYRIVIQNDHTQAGNYTIFNTPPEVTEDATSPEVYSNAWITQKIADQGNFTIDITKNFFAWTGTAPSSPAPGVIVQGGVSRPAQIGTDDSHGSDWPMTVDGGVPDFGKETLDSTAGSYRITTDSSFNLPNKSYLIGLGQYNDIGIVVPIASTLANNNAVTAITPIMKFYVAASSYQAGEIVDYQEYSKKAGFIDFSSGQGLGKHTAVVHHKPNGKFETLYFNGPQTPAVLAAAKNGTLTSFMAPFFAPEQLESDKKTQLRQVISTLTALLDNLDSDEVRSFIPPAGAWKYLAKMSWPAATAAITIATGTSMTLSYMAHLGYEGEKVSETLSPDGTRKIETVRLRKSGSNRPGLLEAAEDSLEQVRKDWAKAVAADTQHDFHQDQGVEPILYGLANTIEDRNGTGDSHDGYSGLNGHTKAGRNGFQAGEHAGGFGQFPTQAKTAGVH